MCSWIGQFGIGQTRLLALPLVLPNRPEVLDLLRSAAAEIATLRQALPPDTYGVWKQWHPGLAHTQLFEGGSISPAPLCLDSPRRIGAKDTPHGEDNRSNPETSG